MHKLFFWNNWHNGDLVLCRPLARHVLDRHDVEIAWGCWRNQAYIVEDLPVRVIADLNHLLLNRAQARAQHVAHPVALWHQRRQFGFPET